MLTGLEPQTHLVYDDTAFNTSVLTLAEYMHSEGFLTGGITSISFWLNEERGFNQGFTFFNASMRNAKENNELIFDFLGNHSSKRFFLFAHYYDIHADYMELAPYYTNSIFDRKFQSKECENFIGCNGGICDSRFLDGVNKGNYSITEQEVKCIKEFYDDEISYTDHHIGQVIDRLEKMQLLNNTILVITADHGEQFMTHGRLMHNGAWMDVAHVPLIIYHPKNQKGKNITSISGLIDLTPIILDLFDIEYGGLEGESLETICEKNREIDYYCSHWCGLSDNEQQCEHMSYRTRDMSLVTDTDFSLINLYNISDDYFETKDLSKTEKKLTEDMHETTLNHLRNLINKRQNTSKSTAIELSDETRQRPIELGYI